MNPDLAKALGEIERGAERHLQAKRVEFERLQQELGEGQNIISHVEKIEEPGIEEVAAQVLEKEVVEVEKGTTAGAETVETDGRRRRKTQSVAAIKKAAVAAKIKQQEKLWKEGTKWRRATEQGLGDVDLEEAMEDTVSKTTTTTATATASTSSSTVQTTAEVYAKPYTKSAELRGERSSTRWEKKEIWEKQLKERQEKESTEKAARLQEIEEQHEETAGNCGKVTR